MRIRERNSKKGERVSDNECETGEIDRVIGVTERYAKGERMSGNDEESKKKLLMQ